MQRRAILKIAIESCSSKPATTHSSNLREARAMKALLLVFLLVNSLQAADGARMLIVTDMEGVGGVNNADEQLLPGQRRFEETHRLLLGELNAAVEGVLAAGASEVVIWDGH